MAKMPESEVKAVDTRGVRWSPDSREGRKMLSLAVGAYTRLASGKILGVAGDSAGVRVSGDEGSTWTERGNEPETGKPMVGPTGALLTTRAGTVVMGFPNAYFGENYQLFRSYVTTPSERSDAGRLSIGTW